MPATARATTKTTTTTTSTIMRAVMTSNIFFLQDLQGRCDSLEESRRDLQDRLAQAQKEGENLQWKLDAAERGKRDEEERAKEMQKKVRLNLRLSLRDARANKAKLGKRSPM